MTEKVVCVVLNDVKRDARVVKEAQSLQAAGYDVEVVGIVRGARTVELQHEGLPVTLVARGGLGRVALINRLVTAAVLGLLLVIAFALSYAVLTAFISKFGIVEHAAGIALVATLALAALVYRLRRSLINIHIQ